MTHRVLLLDEGFMGSAYTALRLRDAGCRVVVLAAVGGRGRHVERDLVWQLVPRVAGGGFLAALENAIGEHGIDVVLPCTEPILYRVWAAAPRWEEKVFPRTEAWQRRLLGSKYELGEFLARHGVPVPRQLRIDSADEVDQAVRELGLPLVVKGARGRGGSATHIVHTTAAVAEAARTILAAGGECFAQEYVAGDSYMAAGLFRDGEPVRLYAGHKLLQQPPGTGPSVVLRSTTDPDLVRTELAVFAAVRWTGLGSLDLIRHPDGTYRFLELNPRPWGSIHAAEAAGVDLFAPLLEMLAGKAPAPDIEFRDGVQSIIFPLCLRSTRFLRDPALLKSLRAELRGPQGRLWRSPGRALHLVNRIYRVGRNWSEPPDLL